MRSDQHATRGLGRRQSAMDAREAAVFGCLAVLVAASAILVKQAGPAAPLARVDHVAHTAVSTPSIAITKRFARTGHEVGATHTVEHPLPEADEIPENARWFNGRMVVPVRTVWMTVTAYSPDARSCAPFADGQTATLHSVWTNGMRLVAADTTVLPFGSMISIPGYHDGEIVPVLDRGGKIRGQRLDVLYPTHQRARQWGVQRLPITVWAYADGSPIDNPRRLR